MYIKTGAMITTSTIGFNLRHKYSLSSSFTRQFKMHCSVFTEIIFDSLFLPLRIHNWIFVVVVVVAWERKRSLLNCLPCYSDKLDLIHSKWQEIDCETTNLSNLKRFRISTLFLLIEELTWVMLWNGKLHNRIHLNLNLGNGKFPVQNLYFANASLQFCNSAISYSCYSVYYSVLLAWSWIPSAMILPQLRFVVSWAVQLVKRDVEHFQMSLRSNWLSQ